MSRDFDSLGRNRGVGLWSLGRDGERIWVFTCSGDQFLVGGDLWYPIGRGSTATCGRK